MSNGQPYPEGDIDPGMTPNLPDGPGYVPPVNLGGNNLTPDPTNGGAVPLGGNKWELPSWQQVNAPKPADYYRDNAYPVTPPATFDPDTLIRNKISDAKLEAEANKQRFQQSVTVPMLMQDIERSHLLEQESIAAIGRAQGQLNARAPEMPTDTQLNPGEIGAGIAAMFMGGNRGKAANALAGIAQRRQQLGFENAMRQFSLDRESAQRNYEQALNDKNFYRGLGVDQSRDLREENRFQQGLEVHNQERLEDRVDRWQQMGLSRDIARETAKQEHDWDLQKFDLQKKYNAELAQMNLEIDFKKMAKGDLYDRANDARKHLYNAQTPEEANIAITELGRLGIKVPDKIQKWSTELGKKNWDMLNASLALKNMKATGFQPLTPSEMMSRQSHIDEYGSDPLAGSYDAGGNPIGRGGPPNPAGAGGLIGPIGRGGPSVALPPVGPGAVGPVVVPSGMVSPQQLPSLDQAATVWENVGLGKSPRASAYTKLKGLLDQKEFLKGSDVVPKGPDVPSNPEWAEYRKKKRDTDLSIVQARNDLEQKITPQQRQIRDSIAEFALREINNIGNDQSKSKEQKKAEQDEIRQQFRDKFLVDLDYKGLQMNRQRKAAPKTPPTDPAAGLFVPDIGSLIKGSG